MDQEEVAELNQLRQEFELSGLGDRPQSMSASKIRRLLELESQERMTEVTKTADKKVEAPERVYLDRFWGNYREHSCQFSYEKKFEDDIPYIHADALNTRQRAERAVAKIVALLVDHERNHPFGGYPRQSMTDIIAAEFEK